MRRNWHTSAGLVALTVLAIILGGLPGLAADSQSQEVTQQEPVAIMPLGDSITGSPGCWRALLWNQLQDAGHTDIDFVGTLPPQGCGVAHDGDNEGHGGFLATNVAGQNQLVGWLSATNPDVVMMHFGTNDVWSNLSTDTILAAFDTLVAQMRANNPAMRIVVAQIIPMNTSSCPECGSRVVALNEAIPAWANGLSTEASPITVVDQWTGFDTATDTYDGVHPSASGDQKMADRWFDALDPLLSGIDDPPTDDPPTDDPPTDDPPTDDPPTDDPPVEGDCAVDYSVNDWGSGFTGMVTVTNTGDAPLSGWTVDWTWPGDQQVNQAWNAQVSQSGGSVTASNMSYNGSLANGASTGFGFNASYSGGNPAPADFSCAAA